MDHDSEAMRRFQKDLASMLLVFASVALIDFTAIALFTGKVRFWFPNWLYPNWNTDPQTWIVYSQSYFAGILFIPYLVHMVVRDFFAPWSVARKVVIWLCGGAVLAFVGFWKGSLTFEFHRETEAVAWVVLTAIGFGVVKAAQAIPRWLAALEGVRFLRGLCLTFATGFLVMSVIDPLIQLGVHHLPWSTGLTIEICFYSAAGIFSLFAARQWFSARDDGSGMSGRAHPA
jgi:hypothetical protein